MPTRPCWRDSSRYSTLRWGAVVMLALSACECGSDPGLSRVVPIIEVMPAEVAFGEVPLLATRRIAIRVRNIGTADMVIQDVAVTAPFFATLDNMVVQAGGSQLLDVGFRPETNEAIGGTLRIDSNADNGSITVPLTGQGVATVLSLQPDLLSFGAVSVGTERRLESILGNLGVETVMGRITPERFGRPENFSMSGLDNFASNGTFAVGPRAETTVEVGYRPLDFGEDSGLVRFEFCGDRCGLELNIDGSGAQAVVRLVPPAIDFGLVGIGETKSEQLIVENSGAEPVSILSVDVAGATVVGASPASGVPLVLAGGESMAINVQITPEEAAEYTAEVIVATSDPLVAEAQARVTGTGDGPLFIVQPEAVNFGVVREATDAQRGVLMINAGSSDVIVTSLTLSGDPAFSLNLVPGLPLRIGSRESVQVAIGFQETTLGEYSANLEIQTDVTDTVNVPISAGLSDRLCELDLNPLRVNFGLIPPSFVREKGVTLTNVGTDPCNILGSRFRAPINAAITLQSAPWPATIGPGQSLTLDFQYAPTDMSEAKANLILETDDPVFPERQINLLGSSLGYVDIFARPQSVNFGQIEPGCPRALRNVTLFNGGTLNVFVENYAIVPGGEFGMIQSAVPATLAAGGQIPLEVFYEPGDLNVDQGLLEITLTDLPYPIVVPLQGEGVTDPRVSERFTQTAVQAVDVLFVIDDSCSMRDEQASLARNFTAFISQANLRNVDFRIGVTTTSLSPFAGALVGDVLSPQTPLLEAAFQSQASVGTSGSGIERGLDAMSGALNRAGVGGGAHLDFLRAGALWAIIIVSDEDDQSVQTPVAYFTELQNKATAGYFTATITGGFLGCMTVDSLADAAPKYRDFSILTGGLQELICSDWANTLNNIGTATFGLKNRFNLSQLADPTEPIEVYIDGVLVPTTDWSYNSTDNTINFMSPPPENANIDVIYSPAC